MTALQELIETANRLSNTLSEIANDEIRFCLDMQMRLEQMSWEMLRTANDLAEIKHAVGV